MPLTLDLLCDIESCIEPTSPTPLSPEKGISEEHLRGLDCVTGLRRLATIGQKELNGQMLEISLQATMLSSHLHNPPNLRNLDRK